MIGGDGRNTASNHSAMDRVVALSTIWELQGLFPTRTAEKIMIRVGWMISAHRIGRMMTSDSARSHQALWGACGIDCEFCSGCDNRGGGRIEAIYQPYIDGLKEISEINAEYRAPFVRG